MMGAVQLHQLAAMGAPRPPRVMGPRAPCEMRHPRGPQPAPQGLIAEPEPMAVREVLHRQGRPKIAIVARIELEHLAFE